MRPNGPLLGGNGGEEGGEGEDEEEGSHVNIRYASPPMHHPFSGPWQVVVVLEGSLVYIRYASRPTHHPFSGPWQVVVGGLE